MHSLHGTTFLCRHVLHWLRKRRWFGALALCALYVRDVRLGLLHVQHGACPLFVLVGVSAHRRLVFAQLEGCVNVRHLRVLEVDHVCGVGHLLILVAMGLLLGSWRETHGLYELHGVGTHTSRQFAQCLITFTKLATLTPSSSQEIQMDTRVDYSPVRPYVRM